MATSGPGVRELLDDGLRYEKAGVPERALACYQAALEATADPALISESLRRQAHVHRTRCEWDLAIDAARRSAAAAETADSADLLAEAWNAEAAVHQSRGNFDAAITLYDRMLAAIPYGGIRGVALQNLAAIYATRGQFDDAERHFQRAYAAFEEAGDRWRMGYVLNNLGRLAFDRGNAAEAEVILQNATLLAREIQDLELLAITRVNYAEALLAQGDHEKAEAEASASLGHFGAAENQWRRIECMRLLGDVSLHRKQTDPARRFFQAALAIAESIGAQVEHQQLLGRLEQLGADESRTG
ncbi:MAG: tetratricopeptide repeat protein [Longimicrobiales bacterium]